MARGPIDFSEVHTLPSREAEWKDWLFDRRNDQKVCKSLFGTPNNLDSRLDSCWDANGVRVHFAIDDIPGDLYDDYIVEIIQMDFLLP